MMDPQQTWGQAFSNSHQKCLRPQKGNYNNFNSFVKLALIKLHKNKLNLRPKQTANAEILWAFFKTFMQTARLDKNSHNLTKSHKIPILKNETK